MKSFCYLFSEGFEVKATTQKQANKAMELFLRRIANDVKQNQDNSFLRKCNKNDFEKHGLQSWGMVYGK